MLVCRNVHRLQVHHRLTKPVMPATEVITHYLYYPGFITRCILKLLPNCFGCIANKTHASARALYPVINVNEILSYCAQFSTKPLINQQIVALVPTNRSQQITEVSAIRSSGYCRTWKDLLRPEPTRGNADNPPFATFLLCNTKAEDKVIII